VSFLPYLPHFGSFFYRAARACRGEPPDYDLEAFQDSEIELGLFSGIEYNADDDAADEIFEKIDREMGSRRKYRRQV
jgi:pre-mRNA-processing factor 6